MSQSGRTQVVPAAIRGWHEVVERGDVSRIAPLLAPDVVFRSPAVFTSQQGSARASRYLAAAIAVLGPSMRYEREWHHGSAAILEFVAELDGLSVHGIDLIAWDTEGLITEFTVMVRPLRALTVLVEKMGAQLAE